VQNILQDRNKNNRNEREEDEASFVYRIRNVVVRRSPSPRDLAAREVTAATRHRGSRDEANYDFVTFRLFIRPTCERTYILSEMDEIVWEIFIEKKDERRYYIKVA
jgi:hypothetical protein